MNRFKKFCLFFCFTALILSTGLIGTACNRNYYEEGRLESVEGYGYITANVLSQNNITLHVENKIETSKEVIDGIYSIIENDYAVLQNTWKRNTEINIYVIADDYILGKNHGAYLHGNIICNPDIIENGNYKLYLTAAFLKTTEPWKQYAALHYVFEEHAEEFHLSEYYSDQSNLLSLTLFPAYFNENFSDERTIEIARQTACRFGKYVLETYGLKKFLSANLTDYRQEWLNEIGCQQQFHLSLDLSWLDGAEYSQQFRQYPLIITTKNRCYYLDSFYHERPTASFHTAERALYHLSEGYRECVKALEYLQQHAPKSYPAIAEKFQNKLEYYISDNQIKTCCDVDNQTIYLLDPSEYVHETAHAITLSQSPTDGAWLGEGVAEYISRFVSTHNSDINHRFFSSFTSTELSGSLKAFVNEVNARYMGLGGKFDDVAVFDFALMAETIGTVTLAKPQYKSEIQFPYAVNSIAHSYHTSSNKDGNQLTYPEAYAFTKYLIDEYGLDAVLTCCASYDFSSVFKDTFDHIFSTYLRQITTEP